MRQVFLSFLFLLSLNLSAQDRNVILFGKVTSNSLALENVHIINQNSNRGAISNKNGAFKITVKENDTLQFSDIQFKTKTIIITIQHLQKGELKIDLVQKTNELKEVVIVKHKNMAKELDLPNADKEPLEKLERNLNAYSQESLPIVIIATLLGQQGGISDIYNIVSGNRKRDRKLKKLIETDKKIEIQNQGVEDIIDHFKKDFFIYTLGIKAENIHSFVNHCIPSGVVDLYYKKRYMEIIDIFVKNKEAYL